MAARWLFFRRRNRRLRKRPDTVKKARKPSGPALWRRALSLSLRLFAALVVCALFASAIYGGRYFLYSSSRFALREIKVSGTKTLQTAALLKRAAVPISTNLLQIDTRAVEDRLLGEPWCKTVAVRRELPSTLRIEITEHEPAALLALESLYLCDSDGIAWKRAAPAEAANLPVITGVGRATYLLEPEFARLSIGAALQALAAYKKEPSRPPIGEIHIDRFVGATLYTKQGLAVQLGRGETAELESRLARFDAVWKTLKNGIPEGRPSMVFLDNRAHPDHITVRFAANN